MTLAVFFAQSEKYMITGQFIVIHKDTPLNIYRRALKAISLKGFIIGFKGTYNIQHHMWAIKVLINIYILSIKLQAASRSIKLPKYGHAEPLWDANNCKPETTLCAFQLSNYLQH